MEEKPPTQAGRDVPRSRTPRTAFGTPDQPTPSSKPAERAPRRPQAAPSVTFQAPADGESEAPADDESTSPDASGNSAQRRSQPEESAAKKTPPARSTPAAKAAARKTPPAKAAPKAPAPTTATAKAAPPAKKAATEPAKAAPAKRAPKRVPSQATTAEAIDTAAPGTRSARARKANTKATPTGDTKPKAAAVAEQLDAIPARPAADATAPAKAMPAPAVATPAEIADDPAPAQAISDATQPAKAAPADRRPRQQRQPASTREAEQRPLAASTKEAEQKPLTASTKEAEQKPLAASTKEAEQRKPTTFTRLTADPGHTPELLALAAVQTIGPRAKEWAERTREAYPKATDAALARLAADQFTRFSSPNSIVGALAGSYVPATLVATSALTHARVILHVAAAYGIDPTDEARAADLLVLTRVHPDRDAAESALAAAKRAERTKMTGRLGRMVATNAVGWAVVRLVSRYFPGTRLLAAALVTRSSARNMAERANTHYSQASHALGSSV
jgi:hypothetical protein